HLSRRTYNASFKNFVVHNKLFSACFQCPKIVSSKFSISGYFEKEAHSIQFTNITICSNSVKGLFFQNMKFCFQELSCKISILSSTSVSIYFNLIKGFFKIPLLSSDEINFDQIQG